MHATFSIRDVSDVNEKYCSNLHVTVTMSVIITDSSVGYDDAYNKNMMLVYSAVFRRCYNVLFCVGWI